MSFQKIKRVLIGAVVVAGLLILGFGALMWFQIAPTSGPRIGTYAHSKKALLVVDIQEDYTGKNARKPFRDGDRMVAATNRLLDQAEQLGLAVIYIRNELGNPLVQFLTGGLNAPGKPGTSIDVRIRQVAGARSFAKSRADSFSNPALDAYLREIQVNQLWIVGLDGNYCVDSTARGALARGYQVTMIMDAIATESGKSAAQLSEHYLASGATVTTSEKILEGTPRQ